MDISILEDLGLSTSEIKTYTAIIELGLTKAGPIVRKTRLQNSVVHLALGKLVDKGLISFVSKGKVKHYQASDPRSILRFIDDKRDQASTLIEELLKKQNFVERSEAAVYVGMSGLNVMCHELIEDTQPGDDYLNFAFHTRSKIYDEEVHAFYRGFNEERKNRGLIIKGILHEDSRVYYLQNNRDPKEALFVDFPVLTNASICGTKVMFTPWEHAQVSFMINSRHLADNLREYFYFIWNTYK